MNNTPVLAKSIDASKLTYSAIKTLANGSKTVYINYAGAKLTVQTPIMSIPYGVGDGYKGDGKEKIDENKPKSYDINLSFRGMDDNPKLRVFHDKMKEVEAKIISDIYENRLPWLKDDDLDLKTISKMFTPILKLDKDKDTGRVVGRYPPTMRVKLPYDSVNDSFQFECTDMDKNAVDLKSIMTRLKGARGQFLIQLGGIWFAGGKCGVTWKVTKAKLEMPSMAAHDFLVDSDEDEESVRKAASDDDDVLEDAMVAAASHKKPERKVVVEVSESEEDEAPVVKPAAKKKAAVAEIEADEELEEANSDLDEPSPPPAPKKTTKKVVKK